MPGERRILSEFKSFQQELSEGQRELTKKHTASPRLTPGKKEKSGSRNYYLLMQEKSSIIERKFFPKI